MARSRYDRGYSDWRGVDFTSDPSDVSDHRFAYALNVWRDYRSQNGAAVETFPGYRRLPCLEDGLGRIYGIYEFFNFLIIHVGQKVQVGDTVHVQVGLYYVEKSKIDNTNSANKITSSDRVGLPTSRMCGKLFQNELLLLGGGVCIAICLNNTGIPALGRPMPDGLVGVPDDIADAINEARSAYMPTTYLNGELYEQRNMLTRFVKERWTEIDVSINTLADPSTGVVYEGRAFLLTVHEKDAEILYYKGVSDKPLYINGEGCSFVTNVAGEVTGFCWEETADRAEITAKFIEDKNGHISQIFFTVGGGSFDKANIVVEARLRVDNPYKLPGRISFSDTYPDYTAKQAVCDCTVMEVYDGRLFFTGNPNLPNTTFYCGRSAETGLIDPTYVGYLNYFTDGVGRSVNRGLLSIGGYLCIFKEQAGNAASVYYRAGADTEDDILPRIYVQTEGPLGIGCYGECCNFADDAVFISDRGLDALEKLATNAERSISHRSTNVDNLLLREDLTGVKLVEWEGYLVLLCPSGNIYLADSRALYEKGGSFEYEWFFLSRFGHQSGDPAYRYSAEYPSEYRMLGDTVSDITVNIGSRDYPVRIKCTDEALCESPELHSGVTLCWETASLEDAVVSLEGDVAYLLFRNEEERWPKVIQKGAWEEGIFSPACAIANVGGKLFFGTGDGCLYVVNTDQRTEEGIIPRKYYTFDNIAITAGVTTKMDDCGAPHVFKRTVPRSCVIDMKTLPGSVFSCAVRTEAHDWQDISSASGAQLDFEDLDFSALAFMARDVGKYVLKDRTKRWSQKQYQVYSTAYRRPFGLCRLYYTYEITGRLRTR